MYIPEIVVGIFLGAVAMLAVLIAITIWEDRKKKKGR